MANIVDPDKIAPIGCSGSTLFTSIFNLSVMLGNFLQQTTSADITFQTHFLYPPQTLFVGGILFSCCPSVCPSICASVRNALFP